MSHTNNDVPADDLTECTTPEEAVDKLSALYGDALAGVEQRFADFAAGKLKIGAGGAPTYPYLLAEVPAEKATQTSNLALGRIAATSVHGVSVTEPGIVSRLSDGTARPGDEPLFGESMGRTVADSNSAQLCA